MKGNWMAGRSEGMDMSRGGVILSGGQGSKMGYADKSSLIHEEKTLLDTVGNELHSLGAPCHPPRAAYKSGEPVQGSTVVGDTVRGEDGEWIGPAGGIQSCPEQAAEPFLFFVSCDMPLFRDRVAECLLKHWKPGVDAVLWRTRDGRLQPMYALYSRTHLRELRARTHSQNYRMMDFLEYVNCVETETAKEHIPDTWFSNVNTLEIYKELGKKRPPIPAVSGRKDAGKTWLPEKPAGVLSGAGVYTVVIKHDGHELEADVSDTDNFRMKKAGAYGAVVYSGSRFSLAKDQPGMEVEDFFALFPEAGLILLEGQKYSFLPEIEVLRATVSSEPVCDPRTVLAYVSGVPLKQGKVFPPDSIDEIPEMIIRWMDGKC